MGVVPVKIIFMVILSFEVALVNSPNIIIATKKSKQTSVRKKLVIKQSIGIIIVKQGQSSIPADFPVYIFNP